jgi:hypothetical protein
MKPTVGPIHIVSRNPIRRSCEVMNPRIDVLTPSAHGYLDGEANHLALRTLTSLNRLARVRGRWAGHKC